MRNRYDRERRGLYRSRNGWIFGVCQGLADYWDISVFWTRIVAVIIFFFSGFWPIVAVYIIAALMMKPEPVVPFVDEGDREFYNSYVSSRTAALHRLKDTYERLDRRIRRMEDIVTARDYDWERRLNERG